eukprot:365596-Chlamydomonas_euryale.AAC.34
MSRVRAADFRLRQVESYRAASVCSLKPMRATYPRIFTAIRGLAHGLTSACDMDGVGDIIPCNPQSQFSYKFGSQAAAYNGS